MAKDFKDFDRAFNKNDVEACRRKYLRKNMADDNDRRMASFDDIDGIKYWAHGYIQPDQCDVQYVVYKAESHLDWQLFRVSLKGLSTKQKLKMLYNRWQWFLCDTVDYGLIRGNIYSATDRSALEWVRIQNYIGALRRGGQLNERLEVVK